MTFLSNIRETPNTLFTQMNGFQKCLLNQILIFLGILSEQKSEQFQYIYIRSIVDFKYMSPTYIEEEIRVVFRHIIKPNKS